MPTRRVAFLLCCLMSSTAWGIEQLQLTIGDGQSSSELGGALKLESLTLDIHFTPRGLAFTATADKIQLPTPFYNLTELELKCVEVQFHIEKISCQKGQFSFRQKDLGHQVINFNVETNRQHEDYHIVATGLTIASAEIPLTLVLDSDQWSLNADVNQLNIKQFTQILLPYLSKNQQAFLNSTQQGGKVDLKFKSSGNIKQVTQALVEAQISELELSDESGQFVAEGVKSGLVFKFQRQGEHWQWQTQLKLDQGQAYVNPVFLDLMTAPLAIEAQGLWDQKKNKLQVTKSIINHHNVGQAGLTLTVSEQQVERLDINIEKTALAPIYQHWIQPFTIGTATDNLTVTGETSFHYKQEQSGYELQLGLDKVSAQDSLNRFTLHGATGMLGWTTLNKTLPFNLTWQQATLYSLPIGPATLVAETQKAGLTLLQPWHVPILDGVLKVNDFTLSQDDSLGTTWGFQGLLTPISMTKLSEHLGWPTLSGKLSGVIPKVAYQAQEIKVDGALMIKLFEGTTIIRDLRLTKPFGALPQLYSNVDLIGLDLETMTETLDFGRMTGTIEGKIHNMRLANWQPVAFDAHVTTPKNDKVRHRISQQAVNNLSELGGGVSAVLSRSALRFFDEFSYHRLGLSCKLRNEVCEMGGVEEAEQGYYMVKGGGLPPRINVIGYTRRVDWPELITRLKAVSANPKSVVQ